MCWLYILWRPFAYSALAFKFFLYSLHTLFIIFSIDAYSRISRFKGIFSFLNIYFLFLHQT